MRLLDLIVQGRSTTIRTDDGQTLPSADRYANVVRRCPLRYVLADELAVCATQLAYAEGDRLGSCMDLIHVPGPAVWIEWADSPRQSTLQQIPSLDARCVLPAKRAGALVHAEPDCRSGSIRTFWSMTDELVFQSPVVTEFDFDRTPARTQGDPQGRHPSVIVQLKDEPAIDDLLQHLRFRLDAEWAVYFSTQCGIPGALKEALQANLGSCVFDAPMLMGFFLLLGATSLLPRREVRHENLNRMRRKSGKPALLEHIEVSAPLDVRAGSGQSPRADSGRASPRLHHVRGHIVRRGSAVYWRSPHVRGSARRGQVRSRTVMLSFASPRGTSKSSQK